MDEKMLKIDGGKLHYWIQIKDSDKWIIFFHGAGCTHSMFEKQFSALKEEYNIVAWDARGHGNSKLDQGRRFDYDDMIQDFIKLIDFHQMRNITIIGQSMGGNLSQGILKQFPEKINKAVMIDCTDNTQNLTLSEKIQLKLFSPIAWLIPWKSMVKMSAKSSGETEYTHKYMEKVLMNIGKKVFLK